VWTQVGLGGYYKEATRYRTRYTRTRIAHEIKRASTSRDVQSDDENRDQLAIKVLSHNNNKVCGVLAQSARRMRSTRRAAGPDRWSGARTAAVAPRQIQINDAKRPAKLPAHASDTVQIE
jgi:hypothetical protein